MTVNGAPPEAAVAERADIEERLPPQNIEAEQSVLGSILIDRDAIARVAEFLQHQDFYRGNHKRIYSAALDLYERGEPADLVTLTDELQRRGWLDEVGGAAYLSSLTALVPTAVHVEYYGRIVERCAMLRRLIQASGQIAALAYGSADAEEAVDQAEAILFQLTQRRPLSKSSCRSRLSWRNTSIRLIPSIPESAVRHWACRPASETSTP